MTEHITLKLDEAELARARAAAEAQGIALEEYLHRLVTSHLPDEDEADLSRQKTHLAKLIGMGSSEEPTDIAKDKDRFLAEAVWAEHLRKTQRE
jgi:hypothetical protein